MGIKFSTHSNAGPIAFAAFAALWIAAIGGYIANIVKLVSIINEPVSGMLVLRAVGIFAAPLGVILGFC